MSKTEKRFENYYKLPLKVDVACPCIIITADGERAFDFVRKSKNGDLFPDFGISEEDAQKVVDIINGTTDVESEDKGRYWYTKAGAFVIPRDTSLPILSIRGTGHLMGTLGLDKKTAMEIQDAFGIFLMSKLNGNGFTSDLPDGTYNGIQSGYFFNYKDKEYYNEEFGLRGIFCKTVLVMKNGEMINYSY